MAYAQMGKDSDVYVYQSMGSKFECCGCKLEDNYFVETRGEMIAHLREHKLVGHAVPIRAVERLRSEQVGDHRQLINPDFPVGTIVIANESKQYEHRCVVIEWADWCEKYRNFLDKMDRNSDEYAQWMNYIPVHESNGEINGYYPERLTIAHKVFVEEQQHDGNQDQWLEI